MVGWNWWTASGPGGFTATGSGLSATFTPTNGGSGTITFNSQWSSPSPCSASGTASSSASYTILAPQSQTNCLQEGSLSLTNATFNPGTNVCVSNNLTVFTGYSVSNAFVQVVDTNNCAPTVTNQVSPVVVTNYWVVSGVGAIPSSGSGLSATFMPTNGGDGTVTFYLTYSNAPPCGSVATVSLATNFTVVSMQSQCVALVPTPRTRTTIGVGEDVDLSLAGSPSGTFTWTTSAGRVSPTNGTSTTLTAPERAATATVTVNFAGGSCIKSFTVLEPASESAVIGSTNVYPAGTQGAGMHLDPITVAPTTVSFANVEVLEVPGPATSIYGYFTNYAATNLNHVPNPNWIQLNDLNQWADEAAFSGWPSPWKAGGFTWIIPVRWRVVGSTNAASLPNRTQVFSINGTNGNSTVSKLGQSVSRSP